MDIVVMSRNDAEEYALSRHSETSIIISITSHGGFGAFIVPNNISNIKDVLHLKFNDVTDDKIYSGGITNKDIIEIVRFILKYKEAHIDKLIVHCEKGLSRSVGIAGAIENYLYNRDNLIKDTRYNPNLHCYNKLLDKLRKVDTI